MTHLDEATLLTLLHHPTQISSEQRGHFATDCTVCAEFLRTRPRADSLDGRIDELLLSLSRGRVDVAPPAELQAILRQAGAAPELAQPPRKSPRPRWLALAAAAIFAILGGAAITQTGRLPMDTGGEKGTGSIAIRATLAVVDAQGAASAWNPQVGYPTSSALSVRLDLAQPALITLVRVPQSGTAEVVALNLPMEAGVHDLRQDGKLAGIPLSGASGHQRLVVLASNRLMTAAEASTAALGQGPDDLGKESFESGYPLIRIDLERCSLEHAEEPGWSHRGPVER